MLLAIATVHKHFTYIIYYTVYIYIYGVNVLLENLASSKHLAQVCLLCTPSSTYIAGEIDNKKHGINVPINVKPHPPFPGIGGDLYNLLFKGHTPGAIIFYNTPL